MGVSLTPAPAAIPAIFNPDSLGYLGMTYDPTLAAGSLAAFVSSGVVSLIRVQTPRAVNITNIVMYVGAANNTPTTSQNFAGLYDSTGARLGVTADQSTAWGTPGILPMAITGGPVSVPGTGGFVWIAIVQNATGACQWAGAAVGLATAQINIGTTASTARYGSILTGQTSLPTSITPASIALQQRPYWAALS